MDPSLRALPCPILLVEDCEPARAILPNRFYEGQRRVAAVATGQADAIAILVPLRQIRDDVDREESAALEDAGHRFERALQITFAGQRLQNAVSGQHGAELRARAERKSANVPPHEREAAREPAAFDPRARSRQHLLGPIDADDAGTGTGNRNGDAAGAASEFENRAVLGGGETLPERDVTALERSGVFPVVERRVVVPAAPPLGHAESGRWPSDANSMAFWISTNEAPAAVASRPYRATAAAKSLPSFRNESFGALAMAASIVSARAFQTVAGGEPT